MTSGETEGADRESAPRPKPGGVFGRRAGRRLRVGQSGLMEHLLPRLALDLDRPFDSAALWPGAKALHLEIGFGGGEHLAAEAERNPATGFIGCEPFRNGVAKMLEQIDTRRLDNVRLHAGDAIILIDWLPDAVLHGVDLLYPDPWPKRRQRKRRFVSDETLARLARVMRPGAELHFATDIDDYAGWMLAHMARSAQFVWPANSAVDWTRPWSGWESTRYEAKALRERRVPVYLTFVRR